MPLTAAIPIAMSVVDARYDRGYAAGRAKLRQETRSLRLMASKDALEQFLGSRFGKASVLGDLKPDDLAKFRFGGNA